MTEDKHDASAGSRALQRGLEILRLYSEQERSFAVRNISEKLSIPMATTYRLVRTLTEYGYLKENESGHGEYILGIEAVRLSAVAMSGNDLQTVSAPVMRELSEKTGETALLFVPGEWTATCIGMVEGTSPIRPRSARLGENVPYNGGATSIVLLAYADIEFRERIIERGFQSYTPLTPVTPEAVESACSRVRAQGYAHSEGEYIEGTGATAAPIVTRLGRVVASVGVTGLTARVRNIERLVINAAGDITTRMGGRPVSTHFDTTRNPGDPDTSA